ncbi:dihydroorotate dehydrogenase electron transfer subunit [uncultured Anaerococcus sp.]|uniref:dihydroorotate dehydrogenase electron transfer subunit n=1 Tax=uncultured Anaerococcus sp. TaxID=293428 RepID=UPI00288A5380|nr:dihydroorotate dehydrogenase electron transfer subunit [uncultured Anaerococcus sp.]
MQAYRPCKVLENIEITPGILKISLGINLNAKPGQFFMLRADSFRQDPILARPFGVCEQIDGKLVFLVQVVGKGTRLIADLKEGDGVSVLGPLGKGFEKTNNKKIAIVAGGIGIAPLLELAKNLDTKADFYGGFADDPYFVEEFKPYVNKLVTSSEKKEGKFILEKLNPDEYDLIYACGPNPMLKALCEKNTKAKIQISMEAHMGCGIGACLGCTVEDRNGDFIRVCKDGPVFDAERIFK